MLIYLLELAALLAMIAGSAAGGVALGAKRHKLTLPACALGLMGLMFEPLSLRFPFLLALPMPLPTSHELVGAVGCVFFGAAAAVARKRRPFPTLAIGLGVLWAAWLVVPAASRPFVLPAWSELRGGNGEAHVLQSTAQTCAPSCAATLLNAHGVAATEGEMADRVRCSYLGTSGFGVRAGLESALHARGRTDLAPRQLGGLDLGRLAALPRPVIMQVYALEYEVGHAIVYLGPDERDPTRLRIADPMVRRVRRLTPAEFALRYRWTYGRAIVLEPR